ncbi:MAG TPA: BTAD domain-containing putative transcriptional regulator [Gemmatimonadaceae bacterium]
MYPFRPYSFAAPPSAENALKAVISELRSLLRHAAYEQCRRLIASELGVDPSRETKAVYETVLQSL